MRPSKVQASGSKTSYVKSPKALLSATRAGGARLGSMAELAELSAAESGFVGLLSATEYKVSDHRDLRRRRLIVPSRFPRPLA